MPRVDLRCPEDPRRLLTRLLLNGDKPSYVEGNLIELACYECKAQYRRQGNPVARVLHRYDFVGDLIETVVEERKVGSS